MAYQGAPADQAPFNDVVEITLLTSSLTAEQATGIVIAPGYVLTAAHVTDNATAIDVNTPDAITGSSTDSGVQWTSLSDYSGLNALTYAQSATDLGIIKLGDPTSTPPAVLDTGFGGGTVTIAGYPAGYSGEQMTTTQVTLDPAAADLDYPNWTVIPGNSGGPLFDSTGDVVGVVSTTGAASQLTPADTSWINSWMNQTQSAENFFVAENGSTGGNVPGSVLPPGEPMNLQTAYTWNGPNGGSIFALHPNSFLTSTTGNSVLVAKGGNNVLAALTGSNILIGGTGADGGVDAFFATTADGGGWTDIVNMHPGDELTIWDFDPNATSYSWLANQGVPGLTGATLETSASPFRFPEAVTFAGMSVTQAKSALSFATGTDLSTGRSYLLLTDHGS